MRWDMVPAWLLVLGLAASGWLLLFRTSTFVMWGRASYEKSKIVRAWPFSNLAMKPWYATYLRCAGVFMLMFDAAFVCMLIVVTMRH